MFTVHWDGSDHLQRDITSPQKLIMKGFKAMIPVLFYSSVFELYHRENYYNLV